VGGGGGAQESKLGFGAFAGFIASSNRSGGGGGAVGLVLPCLTGEGRC
jgi:hypothetical protein